MKHRTTNLTELFIVFTGIFAVLLWSDMHATPPSPLAEIVAKAAPVQEPVTILFAGDMMLGRHVGKLIAAHGAEHPFEKIASSLAEISPDLFIANLEGPITEFAVPDPRVSPEQPYSMRFSFDPEVTSAIKNIGFTHLPPHRRRRLHRLPLAPTIPQTRSRPTPSAPPGGEGRPALPLGRLFA